MISESRVSEEMAPPSKFLLLRAAVGEGLVTLAVVLLSGACAGLLSLGQGEDFLKLGGSH